jgi:hypothetical protein
VEAMASAYGEGKGANGCIGKGLYCREKYWRAENEDIASGLLWREEPRR